MAAGCPIVATNVGGNHAAIKHGDNGSLVEPMNPKALANEVIHMLADEHLRDRYRKRGLELVSSRFTASAMTRQYEKMYLREISLSEKSRTKDQDHADNARSGDRRPQQVV
jgi:glycosyltransferase involved in cell wall biosynthesis